MKRACQYAIIRFMPFIETGEFANVGVVLLCPEERFFGFKLLKRYGRLTRFFENMDARVYTEARKFLHDELARIRALLKSGPLSDQRGQADLKAAHALFHELVRPREVILRFDAPRAVLAEDPRTKLDELYGFYVERDFAHREYQERLLEKGIRKLLWQSELGNRFTEERVGDDDYGYRFPFVQFEEEHPVKVIKPFFLAQEEPGKILDHGGPWVDRITRLKRRRLLPEKVLFAVQGPEQANDKRFRAYREICSDLERQDVIVSPAADRDRIIEFAAC